MPSSVSAIRASAGLPSAWIIARTSAIFSTGTAAMTVTKAWLMRRSRAA